MICPKCGKDAGEAKFCPECGENLTTVTEKAETAEILQNNAEEAPQASAVETPKPEKKNNKKIMIAAAAAVVVVVIALIAILGGKSGIEKEIVGTWEGNLTWATTSRDDYTVKITFNKDKTGEIVWPGGSRDSFSWKKDKDTQTGQVRIKATENQFGEEKIVYYTMGTDKTDGTYIRRDAYVNGRLFPVR